MRILHAIPALTKGGAEKVLVDLANEAHRRGHEVSVVTGFPADPRLNRDRLDPAIPFETIAAKGAGKLAAYAGIMPWLWRNRQRISRFDVIHCHLTHAALLGTLARVQRGLLRQQGPAIVETFHGVGMPIRARQRWLAASLACGRDGFALMAEDPFWTAFLARNPGLPGAVIANGLAADPPADPAAARKWRTESGIPLYAPVVGTVGRLRAERNPLATLAVFAAVARARPDAHFVIAGDGPMTGTVRDAAAALGLAARLHLPGLIADPRPVLAAIDVYVTMNVGAITGLAGLEAALAGLPLVALQARADFQPSPADWVWSSADPEAVGAEVLRLLGDLPARLAAASAQRAYVLTHFGVGLAQDRYEELYARAIAHARGD
ncbi:MAG: glycosyltransferase [Novosphingobium sp.]